MFTKALLQSRGSFAQNVAKRLFASMSASAMMRLLRSTRRSTETRLPVQIHECRLTYRVRLRRLSIPELA